MLKCLCKNQLYLLSTYMPRASDFENESIPRPSHLGRRQPDSHTINASSDYCCARSNSPLFSRQAEGDASAWNSALMLASPAAALLACCTWSGDNNRDFFRRNDGERGYPDWLRRAPVLADAAVPTTDETISTTSRGTAAAAWPARAKARAEASLRAARLVWTAVVISADYKAFDVSQVSRKSEVGVAGGLESRMLCCST